MSKFIRAILTLALIYGAYTETGIFTALSLLLIFVALEAQGWLTKRALDGEACLHKNTVRINAREYCDDCHRYLPRK